MAMAVRSGNQAELARLQLQARQAGLVFTASDIQRAVKSFNMTAAERRERTTPLDIREDLEGLF
jgi:hypothetical protein